MDEKILASQLFGELISEIAKWHAGSTYGHEELVKLHNQIWPGTPLTSEEVDWEK